MKTQDLVSRVILIPLTQGQSTIVDIDAPAWIFTVKWCAHKRKAGGFYAVRNARCIDGKWRTRHLHAVIARTPKGKQTLHANNNGLDNRRANLSVGNGAENLRGRCKQPQSTTGRRGVHFNKERQKFQARIKHDGKPFHIGYFDNLEEAARARDERARMLGWPEEGMNFPKT